MATDRPHPDTDRTATAAIADVIGHVRDAVAIVDWEQLPVRDEAWRLKYGGFVIAGIGFLLTRVTVLSAVRLDATLLQFLLSDVFPLVLGLGIVIAGIGFAVSTLPRSYVNIVATWCLLGTLGMGIVAGLTLLQVAVYSQFPSIESVWTSSLLANTLIGGAIGGLLIGIRTASNHHHRRVLDHHNSQSTLLNRLLRHEVLNKINVIQGVATRLVDRGHTNDNGSSQTIHQSADQIHQSADHIEDTIQEVGVLTQNDGSTSPSFDPVAIAELIEDQVDAITTTHPEAVIDIDTRLSTEPAVRGDLHLGSVFEELLENTVEHNDAATQRVDVTISATNTRVRVRIADNGPGLPADQQAILEGGTLPTYDDPTTGFGLPLVRVLVTQYGGSIDVEQNPAAANGTAITVDLPRVTEHTQGGTSISDSPGVTPRRLGYATLASLVAGVAMGVILQQMTATLPAIGGLYGVQSFGIGWILHLFHSVVFGVVFAAGISHPTLESHATTLGRHVVLGLGYGVLLWAGATGIVMPVWLNAVGITAPIPMLALSSLLGHLTWGASLGVLYIYLSS